MSGSGDGESIFGTGMRRRLIEDFAVSYFNGLIKPNYAEKNPTDHRDIEYLMDAPQFGKIKNSDIWAHSNAVGTGYQYRVVYRDKRFTDLDQLLEMYSGRVAVAEEDKPQVEQRLYEMVLLLLKEGRLPQSFKIQPAKDPRIDKLAEAVERINLSLEALDKRLRAIEELPRAQESAQVSQSTQIVPISPVSDITLTS